MSEKTLADAEQILALVPQKPPFRFIDEIVEVDDLRIVGKYHFKHDEWFYAGHFPCHPITPGVILVEAMAQTGVVAFGIYLGLVRDSGLAQRENKRKYQTMFSDVQAEFYKPVLPNTSVIIKAEKVFWRQRKLRAKASLILPDGSIAADAILSGVGVLWE